jgi:hypothetical protein
MSTRNNQLTIGANDQRRIAIRVESVAKELAERSQRALVASMPPRLEEGDPQPPDFRELSAFAAFWLAWRRRRLEAAEAVYATELRGDQRLRAVRDESLASLIESLRVVHARLEHAIGKGRSASFAGFSKGLQDLDADLLMRIAEQAVAELRNGNFGLAGEKIEGGVLDLEDLVGTIERPLTMLTRVLDELPPSLARTEAALQEKQAELALLTLDNRHIGSLLAASYRLIGLSFHAERLRPKSRVAGEPDEEEELKALVDGAPEAEVKPAANDAQPIAAAS